MLGVVVVTDWRERVPRLGSGYQMHSILRFLYFAHQGYVRPGRPVSVIAPRRVVDPAVAPGFSSKFCGVCNRPPTCREEGHDTAPRVSPNTTARKVGM